MTTRSAKVTPGAGDKRRAAELIAAECHELRTKVQRLTMIALAKLAGVSVRMIVRLEDADKLEATIARAHERAMRANNHRQAIALARILIQVAQALNKAPATAWMTACRLPFNEREILTIQEKALERQVRAEIGQRSVADSTGHAREELMQRRVQEKQAAMRFGRVLGANHSLAKKRGRPPSDKGRQTPSRVEVEGLIIPYAPYGPEAEPLSGATFLERFTLCTLRSLNSYFNISWKIEPDFQSVLDGAQLDAPRTAGRKPLLIMTGLLQQIQREFTFGKWRFESIPGFRIRLAFLAKKRDQAFSWTSLLRKPSDSERPVQLLAIKDSVAESFLRGICNLEPMERANLTSRSLYLLDGKYSREEYKYEVNKFILGSQTLNVFVADECTADAIRAEVPELVDTASDDDPSVPAYPLAIAIPDHDQTFQSFIGRVVREELFTSHSGVMAGIYAEFLVDTLIQNRARYEAVGRILEGEDAQFVLPSYLRIVSDGRCALPAIFLSLLRRRIQEQVSAVFKQPVKATPRLATVVSAFFAPAARASSSDFPLF